jgi:hypothetical protein
MYGLNHHSKWVCYFLNNPLYDSVISSQYEGSYEQCMILSNLAKNKATPTKILRLLFELSTTTYLHDTRNNLANNLNTPTDLLERLGKDSSSQVCEAVAANPNTPSTILDLLARSQYNSIGAKVAANPNTPSKTLELLIYKHYKIIFLRTNMPQTVLYQLSELLAQYGDQQWIVVQHDVSPKALAFLAGSANEFIRANVAGHSNTSPQILTLLAKDKCSSVVRAVAGNPSAPKELLLMFTKSNDGTLQQLAQGSIYAKSNSGSNGQQACYIATATYGTPYAQEIDILRAFRDKKLINYWAGRIFIFFYYRFSPPIARIIAKSAILKKMSLYLLINPVLKFTKLWK